MILAIDIGNTNIKCKAWDESGGALFVRSFPVSEVDLIISYLGDFSPKIIVTVNVGSVLIEERIKALFPPVKCIHIASESFFMGVSNGYDDPKKLGVDRWVAIIEAFHDSGKIACCVFDLGTALTLDVIDENGKHRGGYIVPGVALMRDSLLKATHRVKYEPKDAIGFGYATNTVDAVERGTFSLILAWIESEIKNFKKLYPEGCVYLTGGGGKYISHLLEDDITYKEDLVLDALKRIASN